MDLKGNLTQEQLKEELEQMRIIFNQKNKTNLTMNQLKEEINHPKYKMSAEHSKIETILCLLA